MHNTNVSLNELYADYSAGLLDRKKFEGAVFCTIRKSIHQLGLRGLCREDYDDYVSWLYPRISKAISNYRETGSSFEVYIGTLVRLTVKEYRSRQARSYAAESAAWSIQIPEINVCEDEPHYDTCITDEWEKPAMLKNPRQHLILVLKCCCYVSDDFIKRVSPSLGVEPEALHAMINQLKELRLKREMEIRQLRERTFCQFFRCMFYQRCLRSMPDDNVTVRRLKEQLGRGRNRLAKMRTRLARLRPDPSNHQIAKVLGIAKGTVDAALHNLKARYAWHLDKEHNGIILN